MEVVGGANKQGPSPPTSLTISLFSLTVQVDQSGASIAVTLLSIGGITWKSVTFQVPSLSLLAPPPAASKSPLSGSSSRRMLLQAPPKGGDGVPMHRIEATLVSGPHQGSSPAMPSASSLQPAGQPVLGLRSLQQAGEATCTPEIKRCATSECDTTAG